MTEGVQSGVTLLSISTSHPFDIFTSSHRLCLPSDTVSPPTTPLIPYHSGP